MLHSKKFINLMLVFVLFAVAVSVSGCATIIGKSAPGRLSILSNPSNAKVIIANANGIQIFSGRTPTIVMLEKKAGYFRAKSYSITFSKNGFETKTIPLGMSVNGWYLGGNLIFGGLIGWFVVDPLTGAMWSLNTHKIDPTLNAISKGLLIEHSK